MTGTFFGAFFSLLLVMLVSAVLFVYTWLLSHGTSALVHGHLDSMAGEEGED